MKSVIQKLVLALAVLAATVATSQTVKPVPGLAVTYTVGDKSDVVGVPNVWLYLSAGEPPTPFLPAGKFSAVWVGIINADLRGDYTFRAELNGSLKLEVGTNAVLEVASDGKAPCAPSKRVRLNKGANALKATFTSPTSGDAMLRLQWSEKSALWEPIPLPMLTRLQDNAELAKADKLRFGRELFFEHRCVKCHVAVLPVKGAPELAMDAPSFEGIGSRRGFAWMAAWVLDPKGQRASANMPKLLNGAAAKEEAEAIACFLASQRGDEPPAGAPLTPDLAATGKDLAEKLHCIGCHNLPGSPEKDARKISLDHVSQKFSPASLIAFIKDPGAHYVWTRMPKFKLTDEEAVQLAAFLGSTASAVKQTAVPTDAVLLERGKKLVQTTGCLDCHGLKLENQFVAKTLNDLMAGRWNEGCLAESPKPDSKAPFFAFTVAEREALQAFAATDRSSLSRHVPVEFAERQTRLANCNACHGQLDGFPPLERLGGKLRPEWMRQFLAGEVPYKPRHWLPHQMPAFQARAEPLALGLAMSHGYPPQTPAEPPLDVELAKIGQKLSGVDGGFSCISCHAVGEQKATQVFEAEGINLARPAERLQKDYYLRWLLNPLRIEPSTKMPVYFDEEGKSPFTDVLEGSAVKQLDAMWHYLRLGDKIQPPAAP
jgi:mono/diheme cytochrome c family protein